MNESSLGGGKRLPTSEYKRQYDFATGIGTPKRYDEDESPDAQFKVPLAPEPEVEWFNFAGEKEFALPNLNDESNIVVFAAATEVEQDSYESVAAVEVSDNTPIEEPEPEEDVEDMNSIGNEGDLNNPEVNKLDDALDDYQSGDDSDADSEYNNSKDAPEGCWKDEENSGGFEFTADSERIILKLGQLFKNVDDFRKVVKVFAIKNGLRLKRVKNEKRVTLCYAVEGCNWRIHASPNWNKRHFHIKSYSSEHTCARNSENYEATSTWIAITFIHLFRANTKLPIDVLRSELFRKYWITSYNQRLYRAKNKALDNICRYSLRI